MRPSISVVVSLLLLLLLATTAQGIRLEGEDLAACQKKLQKGSLRGTGGGSAVGGVVFCMEDGHCSGRSRKLVTKAMAAPKSTTSEGVEADVSERLHPKEEVAGFPEEPPVSEHKQTAPETYPDIIDIAGMDYSPAKRKPPIHN